MNGQASTNQELMNTKSVLGPERLHLPSSTTYPIRRASWWPKSRNFPSSQPVSLASFFTFLFSSFYCELGHAPRPACAALMEAPPSAPSAACTGCSRRGSKTQRRQLHAGAKKNFFALFFALHSSTTALGVFSPDTVGSIRRDRMCLYGRKRRVRCYGASPRRQAARLSQSVRGGGGKRKLRRSRGERDKRNKI